MVTIEREQKLRKQIKNNEQSNKENPISVFQEE